MAGESRPHVMADLAATAALEAPMAAAGSHGASPGLREKAGGQRPQGQSAPEPRRLEPAGRGRQLVDASSPAAATTKSRLVHGCRNIGGREGSERATTVATPSWLRRPDAAPRNTLPTNAPRRVVRPMPAM